jgi:hypothetical protein
MGMIVDASRDSWLVVRQRSSRVSEEGERRVCCTVRCERNLYEDPARSLEPEKRGERFFFSFSNREVFLESLTASLGGGQKFI